MPSFSSTRSLIRDTCSKHHVKSHVVQGGGHHVEQVEWWEGGPYFVVGLNVELDLLPSQGTHSVSRSDSVLDRCLTSSWAYLINILDGDEPGTS